MILDSEKQRVIFMAIMDNVVLQGKYSDLVNQLAEVKALKDAITKAEIAPAGEVE